MALTTSEVMRIKQELGYPLLTNQAQPYVDSYVFLFEQVIQVYLETGATTTSSTAVTAAESPTPTTLTLATVNSEVVAGAVAVIDVDSRQERVTIQSVSGNNMTCLLSGEHSGTYPVAVEGGESIVRQILGSLSKVSASLSEIQTRLGVKKADDLEFFGGGATLASQGIDVLTQTLSLRETYRDELARAIGVDRLNGEGGGGGQSLSMY